MHVLVFARAHACACVCTCMGKCVWYAFGGPKLISETILDFSPTLFSEAGSLSQTQSELIWIVSLAMLLWRSLGFEAGL